MGDTIERLMCAQGGSGGDAEGTNATRQVFKQLDTRLHLCTAQLQKHLQRAANKANESAELVRKNEKILSLEAQLQALQMQQNKPATSAAASVAMTSGDVAKINALTEKVNAMKERAMAEEDMEAAMLSKTDSNANAIDLMLEARELVQECLAKTLDDSAASASLERLTMGVNGLASGFKDALVTMARQKSSEQEAQTASQTEIEKLKKRLSQIETDLEDKDKTLLEQETQMLALTDQVE